MLRFSEVSFSYPGNGAAVRALDGVSFELRPGSVTAVLGSNGSGKSTLVQLCNGLLVPETGTVTVGGLDTVDPADAHEIRRRVGVVFQRPDDQIVATSVEDDAAFGPENLGVVRAELRERVDEALAAVGLTGLERREPHLLSGGQKQRLAIAGALAMRPDFLALDEPTSMLDPEGRRDVLAIIETLKLAGHGILHVTHDLSDVLQADNAVVLDRGRVAFDGDVADLLGDEELLLACGLERPPLVRMISAMRARGIPLGDDVLSVAQVRDALWR